MPLAPGDRVGPYEIVARLGAGGMGEVYRARDPRLRRDVAIKILPAIVANDPERLKRFEREAQLLASLNHRGIATIHGVEESAHGPALVMELVDGATLSDVIEQASAGGRTGLPVETAIPIAKQIAEAIEAAHARGVIHRDLKPTNVMCLPDGGVKILDFGLAKALDRALPDSVDAAQSPTVTGRYTEAGIILGTAAYMAPEQARGRPVDGRSDIWAFGVMLFEMITGRRAFDGRDPTEVIAHVITKEPDWAQLPASTPAALRRLLHRCLQKEPDRRLHHIADVRLELDELREGSAVSAAAMPPAPIASRAWALWAATVAVVGIATFLLGRAWRSPEERSRPEWVGERLGGSNVALVPSASPDGQTLAFMSIVDGLTQVAVMKPQTGNWTILTTERNKGLVQRVTWSRDGTRILFDRYLDSPNGIYSVPVFGGEARLLLEDAMTPTMLPDGSLLCTRINPERTPQLHRYWPDAGRVEALPAVVAPLSVVTMPAVAVFPGGREVVYLGKPASGSSTDRDHLWVLDLETKANRRIAPDITLTFTSFSFPLAASADGRSVLFTMPVGNTHPIVSVALDGSPGVHTVLPLIHRPVEFDASPDGSLYIDQLDQPAEIFRFDPTSRRLDRLPLPATVTLERAPALPLPDGRLLIGTRTLGRDRLVVITPGRDPVPFIDTDDDTSAPMAMLGGDRVLLFTGSESKRQLASATIRDGRIVSRFARVDGRQNLTAIAGSPDGKTIFYVADGGLWTVRGPDDAPQRVRAGDGVAVSPDGRSLVVMLNEAAGIRLVRHDLATGKDANIPLGGARLSPWPIASNAMGRDGRLAVRVTLPDSWFWPAAILDPRSGRLEVLPEAAAADMLMPGWDDEGRIVTTATFTHSTLWRFRPATK